MSIELQHFLDKELPTIPFHNTDSKHDEQKRYSAVTWLRAFMDAGELTGIPAVAAAIMICRAFVDGVPTSVVHVLTQPAVVLPARRSKRRNTKGKSDALRAHTQRHRGMLRAGCNIGRRLAQADTEQLTNSARIHDALKADPKWQVYMMACDARCLGALWFLRPGVGMAWQKTPDHVPEGEHNRPVRMWKLI